MVMMATVAETEDSMVIMDMMVATTDVTTNI
jgi:hypothetical protein